MKSLAQITFWSLLVVGATAFGLLDIRDQTCPDGGVCLDIDGNVCCNGGPIGGCMFSTGVCCQNGYFCYEGQFCSTTDINADDSSGLDTNCCQDEACNTVIGLAPYIIPYSEQPFYSGASGAAATTTTGGPASTGSVAGTTSGGVKSTSSTATATATAKSSPTTSPASSPTSNTASAASPTSSKSSGVRQVRQARLLGGVYATLALLGLGSLMLLL